MLVSDDDSIGLIEIPLAFDPQSQGAYTAVRKLRRDILPTVLGGADVRMLVGGQDRTVPPSLAVSALPWLQDGQLATWPDFGHLVHEEAPKDTLDHLRRHLLLE